MLIFQTQSQPENLKSHSEQPKDALGKEYLFFTQLFKQSIHSTESLKTG